MKTLVSLLLLGLSFVTSADCTFRFASYYGDHMVLQQQPARAVVWGYGEPGAELTVSLEPGLEPGLGPGSLTISKTAVTINDEGVWKLMLPAMGYGGPYHLVAQQFTTNTTTIYLKDILFGDVWLCSGQSNMEMTVSQMFNASEELKMASDYPYIRLFAASLEQSDVELQDLIKVDLQWSLPSAGTLGQGNFTYFSAVCWVFGRHLAHRLKYPIGLVESSYSGTPVEAWSSKTALKKCGLSNAADNSYSSSMYSVLWNAMIHPLINMTIKGAIWYQGEQNTEINTDLYNCTFPTLISDWRRRFHEGSLGQTDPIFPFGFVQLSTYQKAKQKDNYPVIRWHQTADFGYTPNSKMPNTFMAVTMDLGDEKSPYGSVHPRDKGTVGYRLYLGARAIAYGEKEVQFQGPFPVRIDVYYEYLYMNITYDQKLLMTGTCDNMFEVYCSTDKGKSYKWVPVPASYLVISPKRVTISFDGCPDAQGVRYAWNDWPCEYKRCSLYSVQKKLPAPLFVKYFAT
ncbi:sialate O-acetylesterase-like isoform X2 [Rana temporaria]|uniref:sialate O-acetylesterase-like isoform X2 n=1 Tax=Rana temporaria TaxID=8407 RepID=UPI001AAC5F25|nr:sialate O-acetylesterase-like isoform X2 [Rana temporaria]